MKRMIFKAHRIFKRLRCLLKNIYRVKFRPLKKICNPIIAMTLLVRNEVDIIEENLVFHKKSGVDFFVVTDHNSNDGTLDILKKYEKLGWIKHIFIERSETYDQIEFVDKMIKKIKSDYYADWVINCDADEFFYTNCLDLKTQLANYTSNVVNVKVYNVLPELGKNYKDFNYVILKEPNKKKYDLPEFHMYKRPLKKVIHRFDDYILIEKGNHDVIMKSKSFINTKDICVIHFPIRSFYQFKSKFRIDNMSINNNYIKKRGDHVKYLHKHLNQYDNLKDLYKSYLLLEFFNDFSKDSLIYKTNTIKRIWDN